MFYAFEKKMIALTMVLVPLFFTVHFLSAQPQSDNYILKKWAISSGGGSMASENYQAIAVIGQSTPPGTSTSENYTLFSGYLGPLFGAPGPALVWVWTDSVNVYLDWEDVPNANSYNIYRSLIPDVQIDPTYLIGTSSVSEYMDTGALNDPDAKYFYRITCSN